MKKVLIFLTNHSTLGTTDEANGTFAPELTHVVHELMDSDLDYDLVSINGGKVPIYGNDIEGDDVNSQILANEVFHGRVNNTIPATQINIEDYDAIYYPGGFGILSDLATNEYVANLSAQHYESGGIIGAVCHGPAGLLPIKLSNGELLIANKSVTGFTREEEIDYGTIDKIPFLMEESLARSAGRYSKIQPWGEFIIEDDRIITGQNPASATAVGKAIIRHLTT